MSRPAARRLAVALLAAVAIGAVGCGSGEDPTVSVTSVSKAEFTRQAEVICARGRSLGLRYHPPAKGQDEEEALTEAIESNLLPALQETIDELYALGVPQGQAAQTEALLTALQDAVDEAPELETLSLENLVELLARPGKLAREAGLESCIYS
jgi:hypothetical protein